MNILTDPLPKAIEIDGEEYRIDTNFRTSILFELMMQDNEFPRWMKTEQAIEMYFPDKQPVNAAAATDAIIWFYACGKPERKKKETNSAGVRSEMIYSFEHDDDYIFSAFMGQYGIDLNSIGYLHWWKFRSMFNSIKEDEKISKIMEYRSIEISANMTNEQREFYTRMKEIYALPLSENEEEKLEAIKYALMHGGDLSGLL